MSTNSSGLPKVDGSEEPSIPLEPNVLSEMEPHNTEYDSDTPPTAEVWKTMSGYGSFITHDEEDQEHIFHINDIIYVLPSGRDPDENLDVADLWLAQIRSIRAHSSDSVWIRAKWFYHPTELPKKIKGATGKLKQFGKLERIASNQADFIPTSTCCGIAKITLFNEQDVEQDDIGPEAFYYRYDYDWQTRTLKNASPPCTICKKAYNPDVDIMHFCPRPRCCRSWHTACLAKANWLIKSPVDLSQRLESLDPDRTPAADRANARPKKKSRVEESLNLSSSDGRYSQIPPGLLTVARQPVVRGGPLGIVGNVRSVVRARKMLQDSLKGVEDIPEDWADRLGKVYDDSTIELCEGADNTRGKRAKVLAYQCPQCGEPI